MHVIGLFLLCVLAGLIAALVAPTIPALVHEHCPDGWERICGRFPTSGAQPDSSPANRACLTSSDVEAVASFANSVLQAEGLEPAFPTDQLRERFRTQREACPRLEQVLSLACTLQRRGIAASPGQSKQCDFVR
jgi:hypothetical protein